MDFEGAVFNAITQYRDVPDKLYFSVRREAAKVMLDAFYLFVLECREREAADERTDG